MKKNKNTDVLKMIRKIREKHYNETKNMSAQERAEYDRKKRESFEKHLTEINLSDYEFPFIHN
ncbi:MAG: hypothetical protein LBK82_14595 [Planctomycetaceae bacterium]|jgi:hypothetical protein|nr:hypothetical protein [Planctomycetaceae bacterium]